MEKDFSEKFNFLETLLENLPDGIIAIDIEGRVIFWNSKVEEITGVKKEEILGKGKYAYSVPFYGKERPLLVNFIFEGFKPELYEKFEQKEDCITAEGFAPLAYEGRGFYFWSVAKKIVDKEGNVLGAIQCIRDISEKKEFEMLLKNSIYKDSLTGVFNRNFWEKFIYEVNETYFPLSLIVCDIDNLKIINDILGHFKGDEIIIKTSKLIKNSIRENDFVVRLGGDEFIILLKKATENETSHVLKRLLKEVKNENENSFDIPISISIGASTAYTKEDILKAFNEADKKMLENKFFKIERFPKFFVESLTSMLAVKDFQIAGHLQNTEKYALIIAKRLNLPEEEIEKLKLLAKLHDIGKIFISGQILTKPLPLSETEWNLIKTHCELGSILTRNIKGLEKISEDILQHHERWDGKGYPRGLKNGEITLLARIIAIADAFDVMTSERPYKRKKSFKEAINEIKKYAGTQFDPYLVDEFIKALSEENLDQSIH